MPTADDLARLQALITSLTPLTSITTGDVIRAQDVTTLAGALVELARAVLGSTAADVVPAHDHSGAVAIGWLDPQLRAIVQGGGLADPAQDARLGAVQLTAQRLADRLDTLSGRLDGVQGAVNEVSTRDVVRERTLAQVGATVAGLDDARADVANLRSSLAGVQQALAAAADASNRLTVGGQPVDMASVLSRLSTVEALRTGLTKPDGS